MAVLSYAKRGGGREEEEEERERERKRERERELHKVVQKVLSDLLRAGAIITDKSKCRG